MSFVCVFRRLLHDNTRRLGEQLLAARPLLRSCNLTNVDADRQTTDQRITLGTAKRALAKAITLAESSREEDMQQAGQLIQWLQSQTARDQGSDVIKIAFSGAPGVGKSTFIEAFGRHLIEEHGRRVAVLAVDPSSRRTGGSILGDKTRMGELSRDRRAYVRPSPSRGTLGGVTRSTDDALALCEAAGYNVLICETVGVGQSEVAAEQLVDVFVLLEAPAMGDALQGIKKGIVEMADLVVVNKADGRRLPAARRTLSHLRQALQLVMPKHNSWSTKVLPCSAANSEGLEDVWQETCALYNHLKLTGALQRKQQLQRSARMWTIVDDMLMKKLMKNTTVTSNIEAIEVQVRSGVLSPGLAAQKLLSLGGEFL